MNLALWLTGYLFTVGLTVDAESKWYHAIIMVMVWPLVLGDSVRQILKENGKIE